MTTKTRLTVILTCWLAAGVVVTTEGETVDEQFEALLGLARVRRDAGDLPAARRYFEDGQRLRPFSLAERAEYFWVLTGQDAVSALAVGHRVLTEAPGRGDVRDRMITEAIALADEDTVVALADEGRRREPDVARWSRRLGESYQRQGRSEQAVLAFGRATRARDASAEDHLGHALALESTGQYTAAVAAWDLVPAETRAARDEWERSRLRALGHGGAPDTAAAALRGWLDGHAEDEEMRALLVATWVRAGEPTQALASLPPLESSSIPWIRRRVQIARALGRNTLAVAALDALVARKAATAEETWTLAELLVETGQHDRAEALLGTVASGAGECGARLAGLMDRLPDGRGTALVLETVSTGQCGDTSWAMGAIERAVGASRHGDALRLITALPAEAASRPDVRRLEGQLRLWTGDAASAIGILEDVVHRNPGDRAAVESLVDAYRAGHQPYQAWRAAAPLVGDATVSTDWLVTLANLALEADQPEEVSALLSRIPPTTQMDTMRAALDGRALLAMGQPAEARRVLESVPVQDLGPAGALALIDSVVAMSGADAALEVVRALDASTAAWRDVLARRVMLEAIAGDAERSADARTSLARVDADAALLADAEISLARERPDAVPGILSRLTNDAYAPRAADLEATARAGTGDLGGALEIVTRLREARPAWSTLRLREAELRFRLAPTDGGLESLADLARSRPADRYAAVLAARHLASAARHAEALTVLGRESGWPTLPRDGRLVAARALHALGRSSAALALLDDGFASQGAAGELRAELIAVVQGLGRATLAFQAAAAHPSATPQLFLTWAALTPSAPMRAVILGDGARRFPDHVEMLTRLAAAQRTSGRLQDARANASRAVELDPGAGDAWFTLVDLALETRVSGELDDVFVRAERVAADQPALAIGLAEHLAASIRPGDDSIVSKATALLAAVVPGDPAAAVTRDLARARVLAAAERWSESIQAVDSALAVDATAAHALRLRAEIVSWSGRHAEAVRAYDAYLEHAPQDVDARRQQARVAGWSGHIDDARRRYAALQTRFPDDARIQAEAGAKHAYFDGRWATAVDAYARWIALEPDNGEARFEYAEALRAAGHVAEADEALSALGTTTEHRLAVMALERARALRGPAVVLLGERRTSEGYAGRRLLDLDEYGGRVHGTVGQSARMSFAIEGARLRASGASQDALGYRGGASATAALSRGFSLDGRAAFWDLSQPGGAVPDLEATAVWRVSDRWRVQGGATSQPLFENLTTIDRRLTAFGGFLGAAFISPRATLDARASVEELSDGNTRQRATVAWSRALGDRLRHVRVIGWAESLAYQRPAADYFAPAHQLRVDVGLEYTFAFSPPRFQGDRERIFAVGYLIGTDDDGTTYHHPSARLGLEFARGLALDAHANWIRSRVYREASAFLGLRIRTSSGRSSQTPAP